MQVLTRSLWVTGCLLGTVVTMVSCQNSRRGAVSTSTAPTGELEVLSREFLGAALRADTSSLRRLSASSRAVDRADGLRKSYRSMLEAGAVRVTVVDSNYVEIERGYAALDLELRSQTQPPHCRTANGGDRLTIQFTRQRGTWKVDDVFAPVC